jgi:hypothetical protein
MVLLSRPVVREWNVAACIVAFVLHSNGRWLEACLGQSRQREEKRVAVLLAFSANSQPEHLQSPQIMRGA